MEAKTIEQWLEETSEQLAEVSDSSLLDARILLCHSLEQPLSYLLAWPKRALIPEELLKSDKLIQRRLNGEPISYIIETREFWSLNFKVSPDVLIPRPETEHLVEWAIQHIAEDETSCRLLDLGTGSGAIAIAIATERSTIDILATDFSEVALVIARENAEINGCNNIQFIQSNWFSGIKNKRFNLILSNPPYVADDDPHLQQGGLPFEPITALVADENGIADIKNIINNAKNFLTSKGLLAIEHGYLQGEAVREIMISEGYLEATTLQDLAGIDRISTCRWES